jgi:ATP-binding cassette subfamily F protein 3
MSLIELRNLGKNWSGTVLFESLHCRVNAGDKIGLIGRNGTGKSTLVRIIAGEDEDYEGRVLRQRKARIAVVEQYLRIEGAETVSGFLLRPVLKLREGLRSLENEMASCGPDRMEAVLSSYQSVRDRYDELEGDSAEKRMERLLEQAGLNGKTGNPTAQLSGGEKNILALIRAMLSRPDLLILDEPGNHLDFWGLAWLEQFLSSLSCAVLMVSHNRYLLDRVAERMWELENGGLIELDGNYSHYRLEKLRKLVNRGQSYRTEQKKIQRLEELVKRFEVIASARPDPAWGKRLRARRSQLAKAKENAIEKPAEAGGAISLEFRHTRSKADIALDVIGYSKRFGELRLFEDAGLRISVGDRVALVGPNGCGKTTLLRDVVRSACWDSDVLRLGPSMRIGYCAQNQEVFNGGDSIESAFLKLGAANRREVLGAVSPFLFGMKDLAKQISELSGGEKNRLQIARALYLKANFLIMDEPTNHLDINAREAVESGLEDFDGTLLVVSHDRYFLDKCAERVVLVQDRDLLPYDGNFSEFWFSARGAIAGGGASRRSAGGLSSRGRSIAAAREAGTGGAGDSADRGVTAAAAGGGRGTVKRHGFSGSTSSAGGTASLETRIIELEARQAELERQIGDAFSRGDYAAGRKLSKELDEKLKLIEDLYRQWG